MQRNLKIFPFIYALNTAWFWLGIWIPFYLLFTSYAGVGLIETVAYVTGLALELPTGALADIIGKKKTLFLVFLFQVVGSVAMALATSVSQLLGAVLLLGIGATLYSGTSDAFLYDTLLSLKREVEFETLLARLRRYGLITMAAASAIGGYLYTISPALPFWAVSIAYAVCFCLVFFLKEPPIDSETFSWNGYLSQMKKGVQLLFTNTQINYHWFWQLMLVGMFARFLIEGLDPVLTLGFGVTEAQLGYLYAIIPLVSAGGAYLFEKYGMGIERKKMLWLSVLVLGGGVIVSPVIGAVLGVSFLLARNLLYPVIEVLISSMVNQAVPSSHRATTLSVASIVQTAPYILFATLIGWLIDKNGAVIVLTSLAACFAIFIIITALAPSRPSAKV